MLTMLTRLKYLIALGLGALASTAFFSNFFWWAIFFALAGLALLLRNPSQRRMRSRGIICLVYGLGFFLPMLHWSGIYVGPLPWLILAILQAVPFLLLALARPESRFFPYYFASLYVFVEFLRMKAPFGGFGWGRIGFSQISSPFHYLLPVGGVALLSFVTVLIAFHIKVNKRRRVNFLTLTIITLLLTGSFIYANYLNLDKYRTRPLSVVLIQGGVQSLGLQFNSTRADVFKRHLESTKNYAEDNTAPDLYIWPENSVDIDPFKNLEIKKTLYDLATSTNTPLIVGAVLNTPKGPENVSIAFDAEGRVASTYIKRDLAPFGEYIPLRAIAGKISHFADRVTDFHPGDKWINHQVGEVALIPIICFEILDDDNMRERVIPGSVLLMQTNNATFGRSSQGFQQLQMSRVRALEFHKKAIVVSTVGFTAFVNENGEITSQAPRFRSAQLAASVTGNRITTIYSNYGRVINWLLFLPALATLLPLLRFRFLRKAKGE